MSRNHCLFVMGLSLTIAPLFPLASSLPNLREWGRGARAYSRWGYVGYRSFSLVFICATIAPFHCFGNFPDAVGEIFVVSSDSIGFVFDFIVYLPLKIYLPLKFVADNLSTTKFLSTTFWGGRYEKYFTLCFFVGSRPFHITFILQDFELSLNSGCVNR